MYVTWQFFEDWFHDLGKYLVVPAIIGKVMCVIEGEHEWLFHISDTPSLVIVK